VSPDRRSAGLLLVVLAVLAGVAYGGVWRYPYVQDAYHVVQTNPVVERGDWLEIFTSDYWKGTVSPTHTLYRPITILSFALERKLVGRPAAAVSHVVNVALHAATAFVLLLLARAVGVGSVGAPAAALLFCVHPLLLQAVANVAGRADLLAALFGLGAVLCWVRLRPVAGSGAGSVARERGRAWGTAGLTFLALASKEIGIAVPAMLAAVELVHGSPGSRTWRARLAPLAPSVLATLVYLHLRTVVIGEFPGEQPVAPEDNVLVGLTWAPRVATTLAMAGRYAALLAWPARLSPDYSGSAIPVEPALLAKWPLVGFTLLTILGLLAVWPSILRVRGGLVRAASTGSWICLLSYAVVGNLLVVNAAGFAERMMYVPAAGALLLVGVAIETFASPRRESMRGAVRRVVGALVATTVVVGAWHTWRLVPMWRTGNALSEQALRAAPRSLRASLARAGRLEQEGRLPEALAAWQYVTAISPDYPGGWMSTGVVLARIGRLDEAEAALRHAIALRPEVGDPSVHLGRVLVTRGRRPEAEREFRRALLLDPGLVDAAEQLAHLWFDSGRYAAAARLYRGCVEFGREDLRPRLREATARAATAPAR